MSGKKTNKQQQQVAQESTKAAATASEPMVNTTYPALTVFGNVLDIAVKLCDPLSNVNSITKQSPLSERTKTTAKDALSDVKEASATLASTLDKFHLAVAEMDLSGTVKPETEEELRKVCEKILAMASSAKLMQSKQDKLRALNDLVESTQRKTKKQLQSIADHEKAAAHYAKLEENLAIMTKDIAAKNEEIAKLKEQKAEQEKAQEQMRSRYQTEVNALRQEMDRSKSSTTKMGELRSQVETKRAEKQRLEEIVADLQLWNQHVQEQIAQSLQHSPATTPGIEESMTPSLEQQQQQQFAYPSAVDVQQQQQHHQTYEEHLVEASSSCPVCGEASPSQLVLLLDCLHYICRDCMLNELAQSTRSKREFKYSVCPNCHELVSAVDGGLDLMGEIVENDRGQKMLVLAKRY